MERVGLAPACLPHEWSTGYGINSDTELSRVTASGKQPAILRALPPESSSLNTPLISSGQPNVFARLQALLPAPSTARSSHVPQVMSPTPGRAATHPLATRPTPRTRPPPQFIKTRIITWNMHDSLPKGNLENLLGAVPPYIPPLTLQQATSIPPLPANEQHPYHLVVVAGQECPSVLGIPMGIGAGLRKRDRDKVREKDGKPGRDKEGKPSKAKHKDLPRELKDLKEELKELKERIRGKDRDQEFALLEDDPPDSPGPDATVFSPGDAQRGYGGLAGWSSVLENWFCRGIGSLPSTSSMSATSLGETDSLDDTYLPIPPKNTPRRPGFDERNLHNLGPYELLVKERMMGIYVAVFIYRDIKHMVRGTSTSAVAAGLIGGRVGNKGGVGVSINLDGTTLLFINAHLAAHEERVQHRLANLAKIKAELEVDAFLDQDDKRVMAEDLTDKFDHVFVFGDLNFRLDITRLHADWLISRKEYAQALAFDQLHNLMKNGEAFVGFQEATIEFPPTFKYDVRRSLKRGISHHLHRSKSKLKHTPDLSEVVEKEPEVQDDDDDDVGPSDAVESASFVSTNWTSQHSRQTTDGEEDNYDYIPASSSRSSVGVAPKLFISTAAHKAKAKWLSLVASTAASPPTSPTKTHLGHGKRTEYDPLLLKPSSSPPAPRPPAEEPRATSSVELNRPQDQANEYLRRPALFKRAGSAMSIPRKSETSEEVFENGKGVYDSSSKQRVPSWCDRILWKSTVQPEPYEQEEETMDVRPGMRPRVANWFAQALRPLSVRSRRESYGSQFSGESSPGTSTKQEPLTISPTPTLDQAPDPPHSSAAIPSFLHLKVHDHRRGGKSHHAKSVDLVPTASKLSFPAVSRGPLDAPRRGRSFSGTRARSSVSASRTLTSSTITPEGVTTPASGAGVDTPPPVPPKDIQYRNWWRFMTFLSRDAAQGPLVDMSPATNPTDVRPRKGDVIPLGYDTLDDQAMYRLEGRSDHRPVIGSYAIYI